jgi:3'-phosphoadenosine 5'-phosphosulfate sulfotransferase (PAPS reductase)/FAD synthetase
VLHLARQVSQAIPAFFFDCGAELPETYQCIESCKNLGFDVRTLYPELSTADMLKMVGDLGYTGPEKIAGEHHWQEWQWREILILEPARRVRAMGYQVQLLGLRKEESRGRRKNLIRRGRLYQRADGHWCGNPLANWTGGDVIAYCLCHDLPLSSRYIDPAMTDNERENTRTANLFCELGEAFGEWQRIRRQNPAFWAKWCEIFPAMANRG